MDPIVIGIVACLGWLAWSYLFPAKSAEVAPVVPVPVPKPKEEPVTKWTAVPTAHEKGASWTYFTISEDIAATSVALDKEASSPPKFKPRWQPFDNLLELRDDLIASGADEMEVTTLCADIAAKLLGATK
jgi:hypothetical protein